MGPGYCVQSAGGSCDHLQQWIANACTGKEGFECCKETALAARTSR